MKTILRAILAIIAGMVLAFALVIAVEGFSSIVHPLPPNFTGTTDEICQHVARYPHWVLGVVVIAYSATTFLSTWIATKIGRRVAGAVVSLLLLLAIAFNITKLPYATWFKAVMPGCFLVACYLGVTLGGRAKAKMSFDVAK
jgi:MFS family permease